MSGAPFRERQLAPDEVRRIVKRAMELAMVDSAEAEGSSAMTEAELARRLSELGVPAEIAARAMEAPLRAAEPAADGATRIVREVDIEGVVTTERHEDIADAISAAMKQPGRVSVVGNKLSWVPGGLLTEPAVTVHSKNGRTRILYVETLANRGQQTIGFATLALFAGLFAGALSSVPLIVIAKAMAIGPREGGPAVFAISALVALVAAIAIMVGLRRVTARRAETRSAFADEVIAHVATATRAAATSEPRLRIKAEAEPDAALEDGEVELEPRATSRSS